MTLNFSVSTDTLWKQEHSYILSFQPSFPHNHIPSASLIITSVWRGVWGQHRWSKGLIPNRNNPVRLKYQDSGVTDTSLCVTVTPESVTMRLSGGQVHGEEDQERWMNECNSLQPGKTNMGKEGIDLYSFHYISSTVSLYNTDIAMPQTCSEDTY